MKRFTAILLLFILCFLCVGCSQSPAEPQIRYESEKAYYVQEGSSYSMELQFEEPVTEGSVISLLLEEEEVLSFTAEESFSRLRLSSPKLELDKPYILKVNGIPQRHGVSRAESETTAPGYIPEPTIPTIPQEPMAVTTAPAVSDEQVSDATVSQETSSKEDVGDSIFDNPPTIDEEAFSQKVSESGDQGISNLPSANEILTTEPLNADKVQNEEQSALVPNVQFGGTTFVLTGTVTGFTSVQNAS